jgi:transglutaminase-like putative cysteine protease
MRAMLIRAGYEIAYECPRPTDFSAWFETYLGGRWYTFDARHNTPRIGRVLMARGRDATVDRRSDLSPPRLRFLTKVVAKDPPSATIRLKRRVMTV